MPRPEDPAGPVHTLTYSERSAWASASLTASPTDLHKNLFSGLYQHFGQDGPPYGLRSSLCTLQLSRSAHHLLPSCNTRYGWVVNPCPAGTLTPQEAPSFALAHIAVGTPIAGRPPHRSRRAVFPHRAPQQYSLPRQLNASRAFNCLRRLSVMRGRSS